MNKYSRRNMRNALLSINAHCVPSAFGEYCHTIRLGVSEVGTIFRIFSKNMYTILYGYFVSRARRVVAPGETGGGGRYVLTSGHFACTIIL